MTSPASTQQNPIRVFVAHGFRANNDYSRVFEYLESARNFYYKNCSFIDPPAKADNETLKQELRKQINLAEVAIFPAGMYHELREWIEFEVNCAKGFDKPIIVMEFFGLKDKLPVQLDALADERVQWNERDMVDAIRRQARHEDTTRWDVIDFKLD
jgi:hypothetical protein